MSVDVLYAINAKTEPAGSLSPEITGVPATLTGSSISIANLLTYVNRYFPDVLPESVLRHFGHSERPAGKLGEGAPAVSGAELCERQFQSTPPARGGGKMSLHNPQIAPIFQSTPPARGGDVVAAFTALDADISIHAPREGGDIPGDRRRRHLSDFNPRPPRGGRPCRFSSWCLTL